MREARALSSSDLVKTSEARADVEPASICARDWSSLGNSRQVSKRQSAFGRGAIDSPWNRAGRDARDSVVYVYTHGIR